MLPFLFIVYWRSLGIGQARLGVTGKGHPMNFFVLFVYFTVNIFYFDVKPKCGHLF